MSGKSRKCGNCQQVGHYRSTCPLKKQQKRKIKRVVVPPAKKWKKPLKLKLKKSPKLKLKKSPKKFSVAKLNKLLSKLINLDDWDLMSEIMEAIPEKNYLTVKQAKKIKAGKLSLKVVEPQQYDRVTTLDHNDPNFVDEPNKPIGFFYDDYKGHAVTGSGSNKYWLANDNLIKYLQKALK